MRSSQQEEALRYFKSHAEEWKKKAESSDQHRVNVIKQRNRYVLQVLKNRSVTRFALDVGCGTGDLVCEIAKQNVPVLGIDYVQEMIDIALKKKHDMQLEMANFERCSIFDFLILQNRNSTPSLPMDLSSISHPMN